MKTKFKEFLNEYGGPGKAVGFKYSEPTSEYAVSVLMAIDDEFIDIDDVHTIINQVLDENNAQVDSVTITEFEEKDEYTVYKLEIIMKAYSKYELNSMFNLVITKLSEIYEGDDNFIIVDDSLVSEGPDIKEPVDMPLYRDTKMGYKS
jgi:hypothetical protein